MNPYEKCPVVKTKSFTLRLVEMSDSEALFHCYYDQKAVSLMNDDNCDFGFYVQTEEKMAETIGYWIKFYEQKYFIRFAIVDNASGKAVGTMEGFGGETGVLRVDIRTEYETAEYLSELFDFAKEHFYEYFGNQILVTKAIAVAEERRKALVDCGWEFIDKYKNYHDYYQLTLSC